jgi:SSS family solute:Na+ symporter
MNSAAVALGVLGAIVFGTILFALASVRRFRMNPHEYIVGSRSFGALLLWILLAGEIYTSFTFLGAAGWAYGKGAPAFYILAYGTIGYIIGYFYLPEVWRIGKERGLLTWGDFLAGASSFRTRRSRIYVTPIGKRTTKSSTASRIGTTLKSFSKVTRCVPVGTASQGSRANGS